MSSFPLKQIMPVHCATCSVEFGITGALYNMRQKDGRSFHCPNGHTNVFTNAQDKKEEDEEEDEEEEEADPVGPPVDAPPPQPPLQFTPQHSAFPSTHIRTQLVENTAQQPYNF